MKNSILHNPKCSKSRQTLQLLQEKGVDIQVVEYLKEPPSVDDLNYICSGLGVSPTEIIRSKEDLFKELGLSLKDERTDSEWFKLLAKNPKLIERPIVCYKGKVAMGRPPENVLSIL